MRTKYIVELEDGEHLYKTTINALGNPVMRSAEKVPYTESDLEQVRREVAAVLESLRRQAPSE